MDFEKYRIRIENHSEVDGGGCRLWRGARNHDYGVIKVILDGKAVTRTVHRVALMCHTNNIIPSYLDVSHLCHNSLCVNPMHLVAEPHFVNNNRITCANNGVCMGHGEYPNCLV